MEQNYPPCQLDILTGYNQGSSTHYRMNCKPCQMWQSVLIFQTFCLFSSYILSNKPPQKLTLYLLKYVLWMPIKFLFLSCLSTTLAENKSFLQEHNFTGIQLFGKLNIKFVVKGFL
jgi:hypothetical protein